MDPYAREDRLLIELSRSGAVRRARLCRDRSDWRALARLVSTGRVKAYPQGVVALPHVDRATIVARRVGGLLTCGRALAHYGIAQREEPASIHIAVPRGHTHIPSGVGRIVIHYVDGLAPKDPLEPPIADPESVVLTVMRCADELDALIALDAAVRIGLVDKTTLLARLVGPRNGRLRGLVGRADPRARSLLETIARYDLQEAGQEPEVAADLGFEVDLLMGRLVIETDGYAYHGDRKSWENDHRRDQSLLRRGYVPLRLTSSQVLSRQTVQLVEPVARRLGCWREE
ncbi:hypothetical protein [Actinomyces qiguomingii]|uniref:hypothetical protein n=1 Tax=Actinomyces qiguomingii TaxID=2057800 RepID=UPI000CA078B9|nr:hypothetical protein [Actinomyces qiguomingii]